ncbi:hypothetical protein [Winogradskyella flava]|uniref:Uncharacterized protein n=1 Tax=Winogradskyella flava TaxID=1884876 RepID=A0A842IZW3_9FLAO|nr:hypothetical protein [Winogradskyella flava]MBC2846268.1 hypothetical protein [Winogradskyella flava]
MLKHATNHIQTRWQQVEKMTVNKNNIKTLRTIHRELSYNSITDYIGIEIPIDISKSGEEIMEELKFLIQEKLNVQVKSNKSNSIKGTIAKYGLIDINFEINLKFDSNSNNGIQTLKENGWIDKESNSEFEDNSTDFLEDIVTELNENKNYLKVYAVSKSQKGNWFKEKSYLFKQFMKKEKLKPLTEDRIMNFEIKDMCITNYSGIWLWKYFYM